MTGGTIMQNVCVECGHDFADPMIPESQCTYCGGEVQPKETLFEGLDWKRAFRMLMNRMEALEERLAQLEGKE